MHICCWPVLCSYCVIFPLRPAYWPWGHWAFATTACAAAAGHIEFLNRANIVDDSIDLVISNCVVNLSPDKPRVIQEAFRVLRPGGELHFSDGDAHSAPTTMKGLQFQSNFSGLGNALSVRAGQLRSFHVCLILWLHTLGPCYLPIHQCILCGLEALNASWSSMLRPGLPGPQGWLGDLIDVRAAGVQYMQADACLQTCSGTRCRTPQSMLICRGRGLHVLLPLHSKPLTTLTGAHGLLGSALCATLAGPT